MTVDTRPPLYLTTSEMAYHFRVNPQDKGREVIHVEDAAGLGNPPDVLDAWKGYGRFENGRGSDRWPDWFFISEREVNDPIHGAWVDQWGYCRDGAGLRRWEYSCRGHRYVYLIESHDFSDPILRRHIEETGVKEYVARRAPNLERSEQPVVRGSD